jgi:hypothetical protein
MKWLRQACRYSIALGITTVFCTTFILIGNDFLVKCGLNQAVHNSLLATGFKQWLPLCAALLGLSFIMVMLGIKLPFPRIRLVWCMLLGGAITVGVALLLGLLHPQFSMPWYEAKNILVFFLAGCMLVLFAERL